ncbi:RNA polymerase II mediator complex subunit [Taxawa tesnikishii (nom. ined.)]|nr:RNA polymerase II mediator complex subunit [Dothideales sp. JES 119]
MASDDRVATLDEVDAHLKAIINNLYILITQSYEYHGTNTSQAMSSEIRELIKNLVNLSKTANRLPLALPPEVIGYVENSRNPDIYTREFVELAQKLNQQLKGRSQAFADFRDILAREMTSALPDCRDDIRKIVESTGGKVES